MMQKKWYIKGAGFTMVELMVVLVILGIIAAIAMPLMGNTDGMKLRAMAQQMASALTYAQNCAIAGQDPIQVVFNTTAGSYGYSLQDEAGTVLLGDVSAADFQYHVDFKDTEYFGQVRIDSARFDGSPIVWFDRLGGPHGGAIADAVPALVSGIVVISTDRASVTLTMAAVTGTITVN